MSRIRLMAPDLTEQEFDVLIATVKDSNTEVKGQKDSLWF